jgi:hypothetical protein
MFAIANQSQFTRVCLRLFIASIAASALVGAIAIAIPADNWWFLGDVLATTLIIAAASVCGLACGGCMLLGRKFLPTVGLICVLVASSLGLYEVWLGIHAGQWLWNFFGVVTAYGVACSHLSMLLMVKLHRSYRWAHIVAYQVILGLATLFSAGLVFDFIDYDATWRLIGVLSIASAAITLIIPVLWRLSRDLDDHEVASTDSILKIDEQIARCKKELMDLQAKRLRILDEERAAEVSPFSSNKEVIATDAHR